MTKYGGAPERRGQLRFSDIKIEMLSPDAAQWVIALNHVSSKEPAR